MSTPVIEQVLTAFMALLAELSADVAGLTVERNRDTEVAQFPTLVMIDSNVITDNDVANQTGYNMMVTVEGYVCTATTATLGTARNDLYAKVLAKINSDYTLGGLVYDITEKQTAVDINRTQGTDNITAFATQFEVVFFTREGDPYQPL